MDTNHYYQALCQFNEGAKQMRAAMEIFAGFERYKDDEHDLYKSYQNDLESLRSTISDMAMDCLCELETTNIDLSHRLNREHQETLRLSDPVERERDDNTRRDDS
jgi:hypothetical protein